jgi:hypothetical protein
LADGGDVDLVVGLVDIGQVAGLVAGAQYLVRLLSSAYSSL